MNNLELADKLQDAASNHYGDLCGMLWDAGAALRNLHTENMALRCTEMALRDELEALKRAISEAEPVAAQHRFRHPQKTMPDWSLWQSCKVSNRPAWEIDSQGYEVEYRAIYTLKGIK